jgi:hypothetical protein
VPILLFYFIDVELGLVYLRVPTWAPFRLQFYCNGHSWLARQLTAKGIGFTAADNAFTRIDNWQRAQDLADRLSPDRLHLVLDRYATQCCPVLEVFRQSYHWSLMQVEYATVRMVSGHPQLLRSRYAERTGSPIATLARASTISRAVSAPMPRAAPDIIATLPSRRFISAAITGAPVAISAEPGAPFKAFNGALTGAILQIIPRRFVLQSWRSTEFNDGDPDSTLIPRLHPGRNKRTNRPRASRRSGP